MAGMLQAPGLLDGFNGCLRSGNKAVRLGMATFLLNAVVLGGQWRRADQHPCS